MASAKPELTRDGTMQVTAKEGVDYLKAAGKDTLLAMQGLAEPEKPAMAKDNTMVATAKEGQSLLAGANLDPDAATRGQQKKIDDIAEEAEDEPPVKKVKLSKATTMVNTAKEAKNILGDQAPDADAMTRGQQKKIEDIQSEKASPKKPRLSKNTTMVATAKEGASLLGKEKLGDTRNETKVKQSTPAGPKRSRTIQKTVEEAKVLLSTEGMDSGEGRRTRSSSRPKPALKKAGTMQATAKEGQEFLNRGKKSKKAAEKVEEEEEDEEDEDEEDQEEEA